MALFFFHDSREHVAQDFHLADEVLGLFFLGQGGLFVADWAQPDLMGPSHGQLSALAPLDIGADSMPAIGPDLIREQAELKCEGEGVVIDITGGEPVFLAAELDHLCREGGPVQGGKAAPRPVHQQAQFCLLAQVGVLWGRRGGQVLRAGAGVSHVHDWVEGGHQLAVEVGPQVEEDLSREDVLQGLVRAAGRGQCLEGEDGLFQHQLMFRGGNSDIQCSSGRARCRGCCRQ